MGRGRNISEMRKTEKDAAPCGGRHNATTGAGQTDTEGRIRIIIPVYEPSIEFIGLIKSFIDSDITDIVIVDDGSGEAYRDIFDKTESLGCSVLRHAVNLGKGRALKTAFNYILNEFPDTVGVITVDSDGQHRLDDVKKCREEFICYSDKLILGCRNFGNDAVPWKSRFGNELTKTICSFFCGIKVADTQTGLRCIPIGFMQKLMNTPGERFEFETNMLLESKGELEIYEVKIDTIYDSRDNHKTHFDPIRDSIMIYKIIVSYSLTSLAATITDFIVFAVVKNGGVNIWISTAIARICASLMNFLLNKNIVFKTSGSVLREWIQYMALVIFSGMISAAGIHFITEKLPVNVIGAKAVVEMLLFFFNYYIQRAYIFVKKEGE